MGWIEKLFDGCCCHPCYGLSILSITLDNPSIELNHPSYALKNQCYALNAPINVSLVLFALKND